MVKLFVWLARQNKYALKVCVFAEDQAESGKYASAALGKLAAKLSKTTAVPGTENEAVVGFSDLIKQENEAIVAFSDLIKQNKFSVTTLEGNAVFNAYHGRRAGKDDISVERYIGGEPLISSMMGRDDCKKSDFVFNSQTPAVSK